MLGLHFVAPEALNNRLRDQRVRNLLYLSTRAHRLSNTCNATCWRLRCKWRQGVLFVVNPFTTNKTPCRMEIRVAQLLIDACIFQVQQHVAPEVLEPYLARKPDCVFTPCIPRYIDQSTFLSSYPFIYLYLYASISISSYLSIYVNIYTHTYIFIHVYMYMCIYIYV